MGATEIAALWFVVMRRDWVGGMPALRHRRGRIDELFSAYEALWRAPSRLLALGVVSLAIRLATVAVTHSLLVAVGAHVRLLDTAMLWPVATLVGIAPLTLAGMGTRDAAFIHLLAGRGDHAEPAQVLAATMGYSAVAIAAFALIGLPFMIRETLRIRRT
jgi:uncharacterized membrane protein YbhN (UPF0104 family)